MAEEHFIREPYDTIPSPIDNLEHFYWTLEEREPDEVDTFIDLEIDEEEEST